MPRPISATISVPALRHNLQQVSHRLAEQARAAARPAPKIWAVIKAAAYGHGILQGMEAFAAADGLAMLDLNEAEACRAAGWSKPILLLEGCFDTSDLAVVDAHRLAITVHAEYQLRMLELASPRQPIAVHLKINTGMNRLGFARDEVAGVWQRLRELQGRGVVGELGSMMHFSRADDDPEVTRAQLLRFREHSVPLSGPVSVCNSAATLTLGLCTELPEARPQWVRPGICLYGASPFADRSAAALGLQAAMTLRSRIIAVQHCAPGDSVGYGHLFTAEQPTRIGIVACGYADGYPRHAGSGTPVTVAGQRTRLLGRVSMDMLAVDLTGLDAVGTGADVVLWGEGGPSVDEVARAAGTIGYELLCAVAPRVPRHVMSLLPHHRERQHQEEMP